MSGCSPSQALEGIYKGVFKSFIRVSGGLHTGLEGFSTGFVDLWSFRLITVYLGLIV